MGVSGLITVKISGITTERNSYSAIYQSGLTKLQNDTVKNMSFNVMKKGLISNVSGDLFSIGIGGISSYIQNAINEVKYNQLGVCWSE